jgi:hypothetical protein
LDWISHILSQLIMYWESPVMNLFLLGCGFGFLFSVERDQKQKNQHKLILAIACLLYGLFVGSFGCFYSLCPLKSMSSDLCLKECKVDE